MDAAAHPTKPSTPPYGSPGARQCISHILSRAAPSADDREEEDQAEEALPAGFADAYRQFRDMQERQFQAFLALVASRTQP